MALPLIVLALFAGLLTWQVLRLVDLFDQVAHTREVIAETRRAQKLLIDMETAQRGYLLTGEPRFLDPWHAAQGTFDETITELRGLVEETPGQKARLERFAVAAEGWRAHARAQLEGTGGDPTDPASILRGKEQMDALRQQLQTFIEVEEGLEEERRESATRSATGALVASGLGAALVAVIVALFTRLQTERVVRAFRRALESRDAFLEIASHELKTPLTPLKMRVQRLQRQMAASDPPAEWRRTIDDIARHVDRTAALARQLTLANEEALPPIVLEEVDLVDVVRRRVLELRDEMQRSGTSIQLHLPESLQGCWDRYRLEQIVTQLLSNAVKFGVGRPIDVELGVAGARALLAVEDRGPGVPREAQQQIFERYGRAVSERNYGGFGLGLWALRLFVDQLGGEVRLRSATGEGARFEVELPLQASAS